MADFCYGQASGLAGGATGTTGGTSGSWGGVSGSAATSSAPMLCKETGRSCAKTGTAISICCADSRCKLVSGDDEYPCPASNCDSALQTLVYACADDPGIGTNIGAAGGTGAATAGAGGASTSRTPSSGGATAASTGTSKGSNPATDGILCPLPKVPLITDFTYPPPGDLTADTSIALFGDSTTLSGGTYAYPQSMTMPYPLKSDLTNSNWHLSGTVGTYTGFGLYWDNCSRVDAYAYKGISFTIFGSLPAGQSLTMSVETLNDTISAGWLIAHQDTDAKASDPGRCVPPASVTNRFAQVACLPPLANIPVTASPTTVKVLWSDFSKGAPVPYVEPSDIVRIAWFLSWTASWTDPVQTYPVDITIDDLSFIP